MQRWLMIFEISFFGIIVTLGAKANVFSSNMETFCHITHSTSQYWFPSARISDCGSLSIYEKVWSSKNCQEVKKPENGKGHSRTEKVSRIETKQRNILITITQPAAFRHVRVDQIDKTPKVVKCWSRYLIHCFATRVWVPSNWASDTCVTLLYPQGQA